MIIFGTKGSHYKSTLFTVSKDEWGYTGKSMKNALYVVWYTKDTFWAKDTFRAKVMSNCEKNLGCSLCYYLV